MTTYTATLTKAQTREVARVLDAAETAILARIPDALSAHAVRIELKDGTGKLTIYSPDAVHPLAIAVEASPNIRRDVKARLVDIFAAMLAQVKADRAEARALQDEQDGGRYTLATALAVAADYDAWRTGAAIADGAHWDAEDSADALMVDSGSYSVWPDMRIVHDDRWYGFYASALDAHRVERERTAMLTAEPSSKDGHQAEVRTLDVGTRFRREQDGAVLVVRDYDGGYVQFDPADGGHNPFTELGGSTLVYVDINSTQMPLRQLCDRAHFTLPMDPHTTLMVWDTDGCDDVTHDCVEYVSPSEVTRPSEGIYCLPKHTNVIRGTSANRD